jgi:hypothetical protein
MNNLLVTIAYLKIIGGLSVYTFEMGLSMTFSILDELSSVAPAVLEKAMRNVYASLTQLKTGLFGTDDYKFFAREEILTRHRDYLIKLFNDKFTSVGVKEMCIRLIILIGNLRESGEDYLVAYNLIKENALRLNIDPEISLNSYFQESSGASQSSNSIEFKINEKNSREIEFFTGSDIDPNQNTSTSFAFDKDYIYLDNIYTGMFRIAHKKSIILNPGMVYTMNTINTSINKRSLMILNDELYMKDENSNPFKKLDKDLLEVDDSEEYSNLLTQRQRKEDDEWNKKILETTNMDAFREQVQRQEQTFYRCAKHSPIFTDGTYIYIFAKYFRSKEDEPELDHIELEAYDGITWQHFNSVEIDFNPEKGDDQKISEETETCKNMFSDHSLPE